MGLAGSSFEALVLSSGIIYIYIYIYIYSSDVDLASREGGIFVCAAPHVTCPALCVVLVRRFVDSDSGIFQEPCVYFCASFQWLHGSTPMDQSLHGFYQCAYLARLKIVCLMLKLRALFPLASRPLSTVILHSTVNVSSTSQPVR